MGRMIRLIYHLSLRTDYSNVFVKYQAILGTSLGRLSIRHMTFG